MGSEEEIGELQCNSARCKKIVLLQPHCVRDTTLETQPFIKEVGCVAAFDLAASQGGLGL